MIQIYAAGALVAIAALGGLWQRATIHGLKSELAVEKLQHSTATKDAERKAREYITQLAEVRAKHAAEQQEKESAFTKEKQALARARAVDADAARSLRNRLADATRPAGDPRGTVDTAACQRDRDRLEVLGRLAGEGQELLVEARSLLGERDAEVSRLIEQIKTDRQAVSGQFVR